MAASGGPKVTFADRHLGPGRRTGPTVVRPIIRASSRIAAGLVTGDRSDEESSADKTSSDGISPSPAQTAQETITVYTRPEETTFSELLTGFRMDKGFISLYSNGHLIITQHENPNQGEACRIDCKEIQYMYSYFENTSDRDNFALIFYGRDKQPFGYRLFMRIPESGHYQYSNLLPEIPPPE